MTESNISTMSVFPKEGWDPIFCEVNAWRGACLHHFTAVEHAITETLLALKAGCPDKAKVRLRHLIGQQFEDLATAISSEGPFAEAGKASSASLALFRERHEAFRTLLCHSQMSVSVEVSGKWIVVARNLSIRGSQADRAVTVIEQSEAALRLAELKRDGQKLAAQLGSLRKAIVPG